MSDPSQTGLEDMKSLKNKDLNTNKKTTYIVTMIPESDDKNFTEPYASSNIEAYYNENPNNRNNIYPVNEMPQARSEIPCQENYDNNNDQIINKTNENKDNEIDQIKENQNKKIINPMDSGKVYANNQEIIENKKNEGNLTTEMNEGLINGNAIQKEDLNQNEESKDNNEFFKETMKLPFNNYIQKRNTIVIQNIIPKSQDQINQDTENPLYSENNELVNMPNKNEYNLGLKEILNIHNPNKFALKDNYYNANLPLPEIQDIRTALPIYMIPISIEELFLKLSLTSSNARIFFNQKNIYFTIFKSAFIAFSEIEYFNQNEILNNIFEQNKSFQIDPQFFNNGIELAQNNSGLKFINFNKMMPFIIQLFFAIMRNPDYDSLINFNNLILFIKKYLTISLNINFLNSLIPTHLSIQEKENKLFNLKITILNENTVIMHYNDISKIMKSPGMELNYGINANLQQPRNTNFSQNLINDQYNENINIHQESKAQSFLNNEKPGKECFPNKCTRCSSFMQGVYISCDQDCQIKFVCINCIGNLNSLNQIWIRCPFCNQNFSSPNGISSLSLNILVDSQRNIEFQNQIYYTCLKCNASNLNPHKALENEITHPENHQIATTPYLIKKCNICSEITLSHNTILFPESNNTMIKESNQNEEEIKKESLDEILLDIECFACSNKTTCIKRNCCSMFKKPICRKCLGIMYKMNENQFGKCIKCSHEFKSPQSINEFLVEPECNDALSKKYSFYKNRCIICLLFFNRPNEINCCNQIKLICPCCYSMNYSKNITSCKFCKNTFPPIITEVFKMYGLSNFNNEFFISIYYEILSEKKPRSRFYPESDSSTYSPEDHNNPFEIPFTNSLSKEELHKNAEISKLPNENSNSSSELGRESQIKGVCLICQKEESKKKFINPDYNELHLYHPKCILEKMIPNNLELTENNLNSQCQNCKEEIFKEFIKII